MRLGVTFGDYIREIGIAGQILFVFFAASLTLSALIHIRRFGLHSRLSLIPLSLIPIALGIFGISTGTIEVINTQYSQLVLMG